MRKPDPAAREQDRGQRRAHAVEVGGAFDLCGDGRVAAVGRAVECGEQISAGLVVVECAQCLDDQLAGHFARRVSAHAVGECEKSGAGVERVLVVRADQPTIAPRDVAQHQCHGRNSITVLPIRIGVLSGTRTAVVTFERSR